MERWLPVVGHEGLYEVSDLGRVRSLVGPGRGHPRRSEPRLLRPGGWKTKDYLKVCLTRGDGTTKDKLVHRLVLDAFVGPCPEGQEARHLNGNGKDNQLTNLCYGTHRENHADKERLGHQTRGERHHSATLTKGQVVAIRRMFGPRIGETSYTKVAAMYGVSARCIYSIVKRQTWAQVA